MDYKVLFTAFAAVFIAEIGDKSQRAAMRSRPIEKRANSGCLLELPSRLSSQRQLGFWPEVLFPSTSAQNSFPMLLALDLFIGIGICTLFKA